jgi:hypothetical protein
MRSPSLVRRNLIPLPSSRKEKRGRPLPNHLYGGVSGCAGLPASRACCIECGMRVVLGAALTVMMAAIIIRLALPVPVPGVDSFARYAMAVERPFLVPERSIPIPVDPALVHPGWCQPATAPICQEI